MEMSEFEVRIVKLEPIHVASLHGFGKEPENQAWEKLVAWAKPKGYLDDLKTHRIFGFNNPNPSPGSPNYGYEFWMVVDQDEKAEGEAAIKDFPGGLYAVSRCEIKDDPGKDIPAAWQKLVRWRENSKYQQGRHQWLEEHVEPTEEGGLETPGGKFTLDLYLPITAK
jgi:DNA gyrase inhibitor GyrI